eukprot:1734487-Karenia_brevis.AAC.1
MLRKISVPVEFIPWCCHIGIPHRSAPLYWNPFNTPAQYQFFDELPWYCRLLKWCEDPVPPAYDGGAALVDPAS